MSVFLFILLGISCGLRHFSESFQKSAEFHFDLYVLQSGRFSDLDPAGIAGPGDYGGSQSEPVSRVCSFSLP